MLACVPQFMTYLLTTEIPMLKKWVLASSLTLIAGAACAQDWYGGASLGQSKNRFSSSDFSFGSPTLVAESKDQTDTGYKLTLGYQFNPNLAVEGSFADLGKFHYTYTGIGAWAGQGGEVDYTVRAWTLAAVGSLPLTEQFSVFGKIGAAATKAKLSVDMNAPSLGAVGSGSEGQSRTSLLWGAGAKYEFTKTLGVRAEYENYGRVGNEDTGRAKASLFSVGLDVRF